MSRYSPPTPVDPATRDPTEIIDRCLAEKKRVSDEDRSYPSPDPCFITLARGDCIASFDNCRITLEPMRIAAEATTVGQLSENLFVISNRASDFYDNICFEAIRKTKSPSGDESSIEHPSVKVMLVGRSGSSTRLFSKGEKMTFLPLMAWDCEIRVDTTDTFSKGIDQIVVTFEKVFVTNVIRGEWVDSTEFTYRGIFYPRNGRAFFLPDGASRTLPPE